MKLQWRSSYTTRLSPLRSWVRFAELEPSPNVKRVRINALLKAMGCLWILRFSPTDKVDRVGWVMLARSYWHVLLW